MHKFSKALLVSVIFSFLYNLPIIILRNSINHSLNYKIIPEFILSTFVTLIPFYLFILLFSRRISGVLIVIFFIIGGVSDYYLINFGRFIDSGAIIDALTVDMELISEYITIYLLLFMILSLIIGWYLMRSLRADPEHNSSGKYTLKVSLLIFFLSFAAYGFSFHTLRYMTKDYLPTSLFYNVSYFFVKYLPQFKKLANKTDLTKTHNFEFDARSSDPLTIVLVIGESMRGDILNINGYKDYENTPLLNEVSNLINFPNATSSSTATRLSLPYMLTSAIPPNFNQALNEKSIISIFKHMGFTTTWLGNQGAFGFYETTYASNILESDFHVLQDDLRKSFKINKFNIYDEHLLPILDARLKEVQGNHFIVVHLLGSHWNFTLRYPESFGHKFTPICNANRMSDCTSEGLKNLYHNTITYSDYILNEIISRLKSRNSFMIYASDHGFSLGERGLFGNAYSGENIPHEQITIGMFSWASDKFLNDYHSFYNKIIDKKFLNISHDYIFHSLLGCTSVKSDYLNNNLNLCN